MTDKIRYTHNTHTPGLRYTVAYTFNKTADGKLDVVYGIAQCRKNDTFTRAIGRNMAEARLKKALSGKVANNGEIVKAPLYGKLSLTDTEGLSVSKAVKTTFEAERSKFLATQSIETSYETERSKFLGTETSKYDFWASYG